MLQTEHLERLEVVTAFSYRITKTAYAENSYALFGMRISMWKKSIDFITDLYW